VERYEKEKEKGKEKENENENENANDNDNESDNNENENDNDNNDNNENENANEENENENDYKMDKQRRIELIEKKKGGAWCLAPSHVYDNDCLPLSSSKTDQTEEAFEETEAADNGSKWNARVSH
jgi:hypothetical protein